VPLDATGYFDGALFTDFQPGPHPGVLDWYTVSVGIFAALVLAGHGALYLVWKTLGTIHDRSLAAAKLLWVAIVGFGVLTTYLTALVRPELYRTLIDRPWTWAFAMVIIASLASIAWAVKKKRELTAFLSSAFLIVGLLAATAAGMYPNMLISTINSSFNITAFNGAVGAPVLKIGLVWYIPAAILSIIYFSRLFRTFSEKTQLTLEEHGH
jgi:cytochrome d ubiquinol oxidase subunit II